MANKLKLTKWRPIADFPYEISNSGAIRRTKGGSNGTYAGRLLKGYADKDGYIVVRLCRNGKVFDRKVHRLLCEAWYGKATANAEARHLNGKRDENNPFNLAWGTAKDNADDRDRHGMTHRGEISPRAKLTNEQAKLLRSEYMLAKSGRKRVPRGWIPDMAVKYGLSVYGVNTIIGGRGYV